MCFVLEKYQPFLGYPVNRHRNHNGAGIDLIRNFHIGKFALRAQLFHGKQRNIHQRNIFVIPSFIKNFTIRLITQERIFNRLSVIPVLKFHIGQLGKERCMAAVI